MTLNLSEPEYETNPDEPAGSNAENNEASAPEDFSFRHNPNTKRFCSKIFEQNVLFIHVQEYVHSFL